MKYLKGYFARSLHPIIPAKIENKVLIIGEGDLEIKIDKGFDGMLSIPEELLDLLKYDKIGLIPVADYKNRKSDEQFYETKIVINKLEKECDFLVGDFLIGMEFLNELFSDLNIDFGKNKIRLRFK